MIHVYLIFALGIVLVFGAWLWRYKIRPSYAKSKYIHRLQNHPQKRDIEKIIHFLETLYKGINAAGISRRERKLERLFDDAYIYGEINFLSFIFILEKVKPQAGEIFYDLGSGSGRAVFTAALYDDLSHIYGIEHLSGLTKLSKIQLNKAITLTHLNKTISKAYLPKINRIHFINDNFLNQDISDGDIIFINATCLSYYTWAAIVKKLIQLKQGSRIIVTTKTLDHTDFELLYHGLEQMSWGVNSVNIYRKRV